MSIRYHSPHSLVARSVAAALTVLGGGAAQAQVAAQAFQVLGEVDLADPDPNPLDVFLYYDHPPISYRVSFCLTYGPWEHGAGGEFVK